MYYLKLIEEIKQKFQKLILLETIMLKVKD